MTIRPATPDDAPSLLPMVSRLAELHHAWDPQRYAYREDIAQMYDSWLRKRAVDHDGSVFLVAERELSKLIGFLVATLEHEIPIYQIDRIGFIHDVWVEDDYRHEGIARQMTMLAIERFRELGCQQIRLETAMANEPARELFRSCGFRPSSVEMLLATDGAQIHTDGTNTRK